MIATGDTAAPRPETMTCVEIATPGGPEGLVPKTRPVPEPGEGEVLIRVHAAGVNRPDVIQRLGHYPAPKGASDLPGLEIAGEIVGLGSGDTGGLSIGDRVCALLAGGGYAEYAVAPAPQVLPVPAGYDMVKAAAVPETFFTVWHNVFERAALKAGERFLVHGGTSGIGTTAIQLAKAFGATVFTTAGTDEKCAACRDLGADLAINYSTEDFVEAIKAATEKAGVNVILDMVGGDYLPRNVSVLAPDGRHVSIAFLARSTVEMNFMPVMLKRLTLTGSTLRPQPVAVKGRIAAALREQVWPLLEAGTVGPVIHETVPLAEAARAHTLMESSAHIGKIILTVAP
ncbi:NAD(P)H-quinone oxidoreductase [Roseospira marina]|uniref:NAD(P)H-quinone oxidoreductase n=1 Tax=Roseospira marina TaxID=140057 RepID=A0A5M6IBL4_9PROT|nr:NAD(P)H-quinone oxidoreductase [Roseospira marina]KAA5605125.1 NAD(P)H-quinone oxidoreductase [Roseospira marina]MBB4314876.1 NADPH2:quinone reductase [Roseospira marina]MBB5087876.1 NADPH2:quinone reductase [Roseospira marina]